tara:strand:+ start:491 stop:637 length:147 start_codon:yes stop_codon:yes gene_type:complete
MARVFNAANISFEDALYFNSNEEAWAWIDAQEDPSDWILISSEETDDG